MVRSLEHGQSSASHGNKINPHILASPEGRETYHTVKEIRLGQAASLAGVIRPDRAREARELSLQDTYTLAKPGEYHIPVDPESPKL